MKGLLAIIQIPRNGSARWRQAGINYRVGCATTTGNIRRSGNNWKGSYPPKETNFEVFVDMAHGYRALMITPHHMTRHGLTTLEGLLTRWAPPVENDTRATSRGGQANRVYPERAA